MGNAFAYAALVLWPVFAIYLYRTKTIQTASMWTILGGFMFLPVGTVIDLPMIPALGKQSIPVIGALIGCWFIKKQHVSYIRELGSIKFLVLLFIIVPFFTAGLNSSSFIVGGHFLPGLNYYDGFTSSVNQFLLVTPFFIGRQFFKTYDDQLLMFKLLVVAGLFYSLLILFEIRMSPQLHSWVYGYFPHSFAQQKRLDGFRSVAFMGHGLLVAFFVVIILISATALWNNRIKTRQFSPGMVSYYLLVVLVLSKSVAALIYGVFSFVVIKRTKVKTQHRIAVILVTLALLYPAMSMMKIFPHQPLINIAKFIDEDRAQSLQFRFDNENILLNHAREHLFFGWGGWGRNRVHSSETGKDVSVTDGEWIITFGQFGLFGFIAEFGLLTITVLRASKASIFLKDKLEQSLLASHSLMVGIITIDQLPNASLSPWLWLIAGILLGRSEYIIAQNKKV